MLRRLFRGNFVVQSQQMARSLTCDSNCLSAKYGVISSCQKWSQLAGSVVERVTRPPRGTFPTLDLCDRFPKAPPKVPEPRKFYNLLSQRRPVDPSRLQYVNERHQKSIAEVKLRQLNARPIAGREGLHTARWKVQNK